LFSEDEKLFTNHMQDVHGALFEIKLLLAVHFMTPEEKISMINKTEKKISEKKSKIDKCPEGKQTKAVPTQLLNDEELNSSLATIKASVVDKIKIFEKRGFLNSKQVAEDHGALDFFSKSLQPVKTKTIVNVMVKQSNMVEEIENVAEENYANDTICAFNEMLADYTLNLDLTMDTFDILLEENKIVSENCFDITISDIRHVDNEIRDTNSQPGYKCGKCGETFNFFARLKKHILGKTCRLSKTEQRKLKCDVCRSMHCRLKAHIKR